MYYGMTIGERLKKLREDKGEKQQDVANAILVDRTVISFFERNERKPDVDKLIALAKHFDVTTDFLLCRSDVKKVDATLQAISEYMGLSDEAIRRVAMSKKTLDNEDLLDDFICSFAFPQMLAAFDNAINAIRYFCIESENSEAELEEMKACNEKGANDEEIIIYDDRLIQEEEERAESYQIAADEQIDICSVKMLNIVRKFFEKMFQAEDKQ